MELNHALLLFAVFGSVLGLAMQLRPGGARSPGWISIFGIILAATGASWLWLRGYAGFVGAALLLLLFLVPAWGMQAVQRAVQRQRYTTARRIASVLRILHPTDGWWGQPVLLRALELLHRGDEKEAAALLERIGGADSEMGRAAWLQLLRVRGAWDEIIATAERLATRTPQGLLVDASLLLHYLRALGETGRRDVLVEVYAKNAPQLGPHHDLCRLYLFAFTGRRALVEQLLTGPLSAYTPTIKDIWRATASLTMGDAAGAHAKLVELLRTGDPTNRAGIARRRAQAEAVLAGEAVFAPLSDAADAIVDGAAHELDQDHRYGDAHRATIRPYATWALALANVAAFLWEVEAGSGSGMDGSVLAGGMLVPALVLGGEWWRVVTSWFLHAGAAHLGMNLVGLMVLGPPVEAALGRLRWLAVYFGAGLAGSLLYLGLGALDVGGYAYQAVVGASGCILGLVGASAAVSLRGWLVERARAARRQLAWTAVILVMQGAADLLTPQAGSIAHFAGAGAGFLVAIFVRHRITRRARR